MNAPHELRHLLCQQWCDAADIVEDDAGTCISLPLIEGDGDHVSLWIQAQPGGWKITDLGTTMMRLSYCMDVSMLSEGQRAVVVQQVVASEGVVLSDGEVSTVVAEAELGPALLRVGQAILRLSDVKLWHRTRIATTFYEDLEAELRRLAEPVPMVKGYLVPGLQDAQAYSVDFAFLEQVAKPLYVFGVATEDKARLVALKLMHLNALRQSFDSLVVVQDLAGLPRADQTRLINAANDMVIGLEESGPLARKLRMRLPAAA